MSEYRALLTEFKLDQVLQLAAEGLRHREEFCCPRCKKLSTADIDALIQYQYRLGPLLMRNQEIFEPVGMHFTPQESAIMWRLMRWQGAAVSWTALAVYAKEQPHVNPQKLVVSHIFRLRKKLAPLGLKIVTVRFGKYALELVDSTSECYDGASTTREADGVPGQPVDAHDPSVGR